MSSLFFASLFERSVNAFNSCTLLTSLGSVTLTLVLVCLASSTTAFNVVSSILTLASASFAPCVKLSNGFLAIKSSFSILLIAIIYLSFVYQILFSLR